jgi:hypothetical protein
VLRRRQAKFEPKADGQHSEAKLFSDPQKIVILYLVAIATVILGLPFGLMQYRSDADFWRTIASIFFWVLTVSALLLAPLLLRLNYLERQDLSDR